MWRPFSFEDRINCTLENFRWRFSFFGCDFDRNGSKN